MIVREATDADLIPLVNLTKETLTKLGIPVRPSLSANNIQREGTYTVVLYDGRNLVASVSARPLATDRGPAFQVGTFLVRQERKDKLYVLDALSLYALNFAVAKGRRIIRTERLRHIPGMVYGRDHLGMNATQGDNVYLHQWGRAPDMMKRILERHPEWSFP